MDGKSLVVGFVSGGLTNALLHPLDSVKTRLQAAGRGQRYHSRLTIRDTFLVTRNIIATEGWTALYQGLTSSILGASSSWGLYFFVYNSSKNYFFKSGDYKSMNDLPTLALLASSINAGLITCLITHPIWLVKTRLQLQQRNQSISESPQYYKGTLDAFWKIAKNEGITRGLYLGLSPSLFLISHGVIHFVLYDLFKAVYLKRFKNDAIYLNSYESFTLAGLAKAIAVLSTYPLQVVKTRLQDLKNKAPNMDKNLQYNGMIDAMRKMYKLEGAASFFRGIIPHLARNTPSGAITFALYEYFSKLYDKTENLLQRN